MMDKYKAKFDELYNRWAKEEWSEEDPTRLIRLARELVGVNPNNAKAWDALATSIMGLLFPPGKELTDKEKEDIKNDELFWEMVDAFGHEMELDQDEPAAPWNRAIIFDRVGLFKRAYEDYLRVAEIEKRNPPPDEPFTVYNDLYLAGRAIYKYGDYSRAVKTLKAAITEGGENESEIWYYLALSLEKLAKYSEALGAYKKAALLNPKAFEEKFLAAEKRLGHEG